MSPPGWLRVVRLSVADAGALAAIDAEVAPDPWTIGLAAAELGRDDRTVHGAVVDADDGRGGQVGRVVGFAAWADLAGEAHVLNVAVAADWQRRGIGGALLDAALDAVAAAGIDAVTLEVRRSNAAGLALYRRRGFASAGVRPRYYPDGEDAVILWRR